MLIYSWVCLDLKIFLWPLFIVCQLNKLIYIFHLLTAYQKFQLVIQHICFTVHKLTWLFTNISQYNIFYKLHRVIQHSDQIYDDFWSGYCYINLAYVFFICIYFEYLNSNWNLQGEETNYYLYKWGILFTIKVLIQ